MTRIEKDILLLISRVRCISESQIKKLFNSKKIYSRRYFNKTLNRMCSELTLKRCWCDLESSIFRDKNVYYLNGNEIYNGDKLKKALIGTELLLKLKISGCEVERFYRNINFNDEVYDMYILFTDRYGELRQILCDIVLEDETYSDISFNKYRNLRNQIYNSTVPFFEIPKILIIAPSNICSISEKYFHKDFLNLNFVDYNFNRLFNYL